MNLASQRAEEKTRGEPNHGGIGRQWRWRNRFPWVHGHDVQPGPSGPNRDLRAGHGTFVLIFFREIHGDISWEWDGFVYVIYNIVHTKFIFCCENCIISGSVVSIIVGVSCLCHYSIATTVYIVWVIYTLHPIINRPVGYRNLKTYTVIRKMQRH